MESWRVEIGELSGVHDDTIADELLDGVGDVPDAVESLSDTADQAPTLRPAMPRST